MDLHLFEPAGDEALLLGALAVRFRLVGQVAVDALVASQGARRLGELLVEAGHLTARQRDELLSLQAFLRVRVRDRRFAKEVLETGYITEDEVEYAFRAQESAYENDRSCRPVGELLVELGSIDEGLRAEIEGQVDASG